MLETLYDPETMETKPKNTESKDIQSKDAQSKNKKDISAFDCRAACIHGNAGRLRTAR